LEEPQMSVMSLATYALFLLVVVALVKPVGGYLARVFAGEWTPLDPLLRPVERAIYRLGGIDAERQMDFKQYARSFVLFGLVGTLLLYAILRLQALIPPGSQCGVPDDAHHARSGVQYRRQLHDDHDVAGVCRREHDELSQPDRRVGGAELLRRRGGAGGRHRLHPGLRRQSHELAG
jgi:hypothetical protein